MEELNRVAEDTYGRDKQTHRRIVQSKKELNQEERNWS